MPAKVTDRDGSEFKLSLEEASAIADVSVMTVIRAAENGHIECRRTGLGPRRQRHFHPTDIEWLRQQYHVPQKDQTALVGSRA